jgi:hypothetical protein
MKQNSERADKLYEKINPIKKYGICSVVNSENNVVSRKQKTEFLLFVKKHFSILHSQLSIKNSSQELQTKSRKLPLPLSF